jgi:hypothetical protein
VASGQWVWLVFPAEELGLSPALHLDRKLLRALPWSPWASACFEQSIDAAVWTTGLRDRAAEVAAGAAAAPADVAGADPAVVEGAAATASGPHSDVRKAFRFMPLRVPAERAASYFTPHSFELKACAGAAESHAIITALPVIAR